jgi:DUF4097 and DUF4098 domain-containing protein YvlB
MPGSSFIRLAAIHKIILIVLLSVPLCLASDHWNYEESHSESREFVTGGMLHLRLSVGDVRIRRSDSNKIRLEYTVKSRRESQLKDAHVDFEVHGNDARIEFHAPEGSRGNTQFDVELEVPSNTNLDVHEKVGDLTVEDVEGDKELELSVGDIRVAAERSAYHLVNASASIGDVNGNGYGETSGWLGKTLKYHGDGKYELRAHVGVGDITLEGK